MLKSGYFKNEVKYLNWLKINGKSKGYIRDITNILNKFFYKEIKTIDDLKHRYANNRLNKKYLYLALRNWLKFCDEEEILDEDIINRIKKFTKNPKKSQIDSFVPSKYEISKLLADIKRFNYIDYIGLQILIQSGLRISEVVYFRNNFDFSKVEIVGDIVIYSLFHMRGQKNSYYLFMSKSIYDEYLKYDFRRFNFERLKTHIKRDELIPLKYMRKYNFTMLVSAGVEFEIANFIQGRSSNNIGFNHYLAKKELAVKEYGKIL